MLDSHERADWMFFEKSKVERAGWMLASNRQFLNCEIDFQLFTLGGDNNWLI